MICALLPSFQSRNIDKLNQKLDVLKMPPDVRRRYENYLLRRASDEGVIEAAERKGVKKGIKQGRKEGRKDGEEKRNIEIARKLLPILDDAAISETTGVSVEQIAGLRKDPKR